MALSSWSRVRSIDLEKVLWVVLALGMTVTAALLTPNVNGHGTHTQLGMPPCAWVAWFNRPCPACGLTTSITALVHGQLGDSIRANAFGPVIFLIVWGMAVTSVLELKTGKMIDPTRKFQNRLFGALLVAFLAFGIVRMAVSDGYATPTDFAAIRHVIVR